MGLTSSTFVKLPARDTKHEAGTQSENLLLWAQLWHVLVSGYACRTNLSCLGDRLTAIEGLAEYFRHWRQGERYFGGIWSGSFAKDLLWRTIPEFHERLRVRPDTIKTKWSSEKWLFPTWSWASLNNKNPMGPRMSILYAKFREEVAVDSPSPPTYQHYPDSAFLITPIGEPFGQDRIADGQKPPPSTEKRRYHELRIQGIIVPIGWQQLLAMEKDAWAENIEPYPEPFFMCDYGWLKFANWLKEEYPAGPAEPTFYCLRMMKYIGRTGHFMGLVLHCVDEARQIYERIGVLAQRYRLEKDDTEESKRHWKPDWRQEAGTESEPEARVITLV